MKITRLAVRNFCGAYRIDVEPREPLVLICGPNGSGKSSMAEALCVSLVGHGTRVSKSSDWPLLVSEGSKEAVIALHVEHEEGRTIKRTQFPGGEVNRDGPLLPQPEFLLFVTDSARFARLEKDDRRRVLFDLLGASKATTPDAVERILIERGVSEAHASEAASIMRGGFDTLHDYATEQAKAARASWRAITGEVYGARKAETWAAPAVSFSAEYLDHVVTRLKEIGPELDEAQRALGAVEERQRIAARAAQSVACPHCAGLLMIHGDRLEPYSAAEQTDRDAMAQLMEEAGQARRRVDELRSVSDALTEQRREQEIGQAQSLEAEKRTEAAAAYHADVIQWSKVADLSAPDGIPSELLHNVLGLFNGTLRQFAHASGFQQIAVTPALEITADGRPYLLLSESERWRADMTLAIAFAHYSGLRFVSLDRFDVLDAHGRDLAVRWLEHLFQHEALEQAFLFATLRQPPQAEPGFMEVKWISHGEVEQPRQGAR
ncbi:AAA family ATPase [Burkholderia ubonensis]|uniref:AAA family ATPase n=1 Tax=Burkholderia ubonensis TaxID=101571 RepID=UPI0009B48D0F|nr:AAA family ATPase [Burkholderia ubonensis]